MLIECKICGELCKDDIGLRNHVTGKKDHPSMAEYRENYIKNPQSKIKIDYIIPIANINDDGFSYRLKNLNSILRIIPDFINVVLIEQMINPVYKLYTKSLNSLPNNLSITRKVVGFQIFNKGWLYNIGVNYSKTNHIILAEGDININRKYFIDLKDFILNNDHKWFFAWNKIIYWNEDFTKKLRVDTPRETMAEGGLVYFNKNFYWKIGGSNEFFQELGGVDNELAARARFVTGEDKLFEGTINHLWHPVSYLKKNNWKYGKYYIKNRILYYQVKDNPELAIDELKKIKIGRLISPVDNNCKNSFLKSLNIREVPIRKRYR